MVATGFVLLSGCVSYDKYDAWLQGEYESKKKEQEEFERIKSNYSHIIDFSNEEDLGYAGGKGEIKKDTFYLKGTGEKEHEAIRFDGLSYRSMKRLAIGVKGKNTEKNIGFVEILLGVINPGTEEKDEINFRTAGESKYKFTQGKWTLIEAVKTDNGNATEVYVDGKKRYEKPFPFQSLTIFVFVEGKVQVDYVLYGK